MASDCLCCAQLQPDDVAGHTLWGLEGERLRQGMGRCRHARVLAPQDGHERCAGLLVELLRRLTHVTHAA